MASLLHLQQNFRDGVSCWDQVPRPRTCPSGPALGPSAGRGRVFPTVFSAVDGQLLHAFWKTLGGGCLVEGPQAGEERQEVRQGGSCGAL